MPIVWDHGSNDPITQLTNALSQAQPGVFAALNYKLAKRRSDQEDERARRQDELYRQRLEQMNTLAERDDKRQQEELDLSKKREERFSAEDDRQKAEREAVGQASRTYLSWLHGGEDQPIPMLPTGPRQGGVQGLTEKLGPSMEAMGPEGLNSMLGTIEDEQRREENQRQFGLFQQMLGSYTKGGTDAAGKPKQPLIDPGTAQLLTAQAMVDPKGAGDTVGEIAREHSKGAGQLRYRGYAKTVIDEAVKKAEVEAALAQAMGLDDEWQDEIHQRLQDAYVEQDLFENAEYMQGPAITESIRRTHSALKGKKGTGKQDEPFDRALKVWQHLPDEERTPERLDELEQVYGQRMRPQRTGAGPDFQTMQPGMPEAPKPPPTPDERAGAFFSPETLRPGIFSTGPMDAEEKSLGEREGEIKAGIGKYTSKAEQASLDEVQKRRTELGEERKAKGALDDRVLRVIRSEFGDEPETEEELKDAIQKLEDKLSTMSSPSVGPGTFRGGFSSRADIEETLKRLRAKAAQKPK